MGRSYDLTKVDPGRTITNGTESKPDDESAVPEHEEKNPGKQNMVGMLDMFRFADTKDRLLLVVATITSMLHGAAQPMMIIVFGYMADTFINDAIFNKILDELMPNITMYYPNVTKDMITDDPTIIFPVLEDLNRTDLIKAIEDSVATDLLVQMEQYAIYYCILGACVFVLSYIHITCWQASAYRQCQRIRSLLFESILKQEIGWYDTHDTGELNSRLADDVNQIQEGIGDKLGMFMQFFTTFIVAYIVGFVHGWKLTLVILAIAPLLVLASGTMSKLGAIFTSKELNAYAKAGAVAEEAIGSIRTVFAFGGQKKEVERYSANLHDAKVVGIKKGVITGIGMGAVFLILFCSYSIAFWYGSTLVWAKEYTGGTVLLVFFSVMIGSFSMGNAAPNLQEFSQARGAAYKVYQIIDMVPKIDSSSPLGCKPDKMVGNVEFRDVRFTYPSRKEVPVLNGLNLKVNVGQTVALVGSSGCGKSTTVQLIQRFYDPLEGQVLIDGQDIREYNIKWLRQKIGVVSQEPVLFDTTIAENIRYGQDGVSQDQIEKACRNSNAHNFIIKLPKGYDTLVGERGTQLSGGQKQRIAIARALVRDPKILLLDEATSALDTESEASVQAALDKAREGRTTIVIAHRLSTIKNADKIASFENGKIKEEGSHDELMQIQGIYRTLVENQSMQDKDGVMEKEFIPSTLQHQLSVTSVDFKTQQSIISSASLDNKAQRALSMNQEEELELPSLSRVMRMNSPEWGWILLGCVGSFIAGGIQPTFAVMISEVLGVYSELDEDKQRDDVKIYSGMMVVIGIIAGLSMFIMNYAFAYSGEKLTERLRNLTFYALLKQDVGYFDDTRNSTGALCTRLSTDASAVKGATGVRFGTLIRSLSSIGVGLGIGFYFSWKLSLVILAFAPLMILSGFIQAKLFNNQMKSSRVNLEGAGKVAVEAIENIRTVATLTKEELFHKEYYQLTLEPIKKNMRQAHALGLGYGISQATIFFAYAASYSFGAVLIKRDEIVYEDLYKVVIAIAMGAVSVGQANSFAPDYGKAKEAAAKCFELLDRQPAIDSFSEGGISPDGIESNVNLDRVEFSYPTRMNIQVLRGLTLDVQQGQTVALVGSSGCGKSTVIQLLQRYYDPLSGHLNLDNIDTTSLNLQWLRGQMGIVSQEPVLFDASIRENIEYGDNTRDIPMQDIIQAAKDANIHNFIQTLPNGYDTNVGDKGTQLSGGQKQRVAIARALVRNPKLLLLDEATSALDTESEKVVQEALDRAQEGRTSIVIAHRLSTIQNADKIIVIKSGQVIETGTHTELLAKKGFYHKLNVVQMRNTRQ